MDEITPVQRLKQIGFRKLGDCTCNRAGLAFNVEEWPSGANALYAFVVGMRVVYIGKTRATIKKRLSGYLKPHEGQRTNFRNHGMLHKAATIGRLVTIYAFVDSGLLSYGGFHVDLAAGLEDALIEEFNPQWNKGRKAKPPVAGGCSPGCRDRA